MTYNSPSIRMSLAWCFCCVPTSAGLPLENCSSAVPLTFGWTPRLFGTENSCLDTALCLWLWGLPVSHILYLGLMAGVLC